MFLSTETAMATDSTSSDRLNPSILIVTPNNITSSSLHAILSFDYSKKNCFGSGSDAIKYLKEKHCNLIFLDLHLGDMDVKDFIAFRNRYSSNTEILLIVGKYELNDLISYAKKGIYSCITLPLDMEEVLDSAKKAIKHNKKRNIKKEIDYNFMNNPLKDDYEIIRVLGITPASVVMKVREKKDRQKVYAMKLIRNPIDIKNDETSNNLQRFFREARILSQISHPGIVKIYKLDVPEDKRKSPFILMEYVEGQSLRNCMNRKILSFEQKFSIFQQIAVALKIVHDKNIWHRDLKPDNIMLTKKDLIKLMDFGISKLRDSSITMPEEIMGSPAYMSPEGFTFSKKIDHRSDLFSLGILAYELFLGKRPFIGNSISELVFSIQHANPKEPRKIKSSFPLKLQRIIEKLLNKDPRYRYQKTEDLCKALNHARLHIEDAKLTNFYHQYFPPIFSHSVWS